MEVERSEFTTISSEERLLLAQKAYRDFNAQCFWYMREDLIVTEENLPEIVKGLKLNGGHKGWKLAHALCQ